MHTDKQIPYLILIRLRGKSKNRALSMETAPCQFPGQKIRTPQEGYFNCLLLAMPSDEDLKMCELLVSSLRILEEEGGSSFPHGWWKPESRKGLENMSGMWNFSDAQITTDDDPKLIDREQGIPHLKGCPCSVSSFRRKK